MVSHSYRSPSPTITARCAAGAYVSPARWLAPLSHRGCAALSAAIEQCNDEGMLFPLDVVADRAGDVPSWPLILLAMAAAMVIFFIFVQLRRILRNRPPRDDSP